MMTPRSADEAPDIPAGTERITDPGERYIQNPYAGSEMLTEEEAIETIEHLSSMMKIKRRTSGAIVRNGN